MPIKRSAILLMLIMAMLVGPSPAMAQGSDISIQTLSISIWPEYDQRAALVFFGGQSSAIGPVDLTFNLPASATINAVAFRQSDGTLANASFQQQGNALTLTSPNGSFHIEFYDASLQFDGSKRLYTLTWVSPYPVAALTWEVQQPAGATDMTVAPGTATLAHDQFGLSLYLVQAGAVGANQPATLAVGYSKPNNALTVEQLPGTTVTPINVEPLTEPGEAGGVPDAILLVIIGVIGAALAGVAGYFYAESRRTRARLAMAEAAPPPSDVPPVSAPASPAAPTSGAAPDPALTDRELEVLKLVGEGLVNSDIGRRLGISPKTVARHRENIMQKLNLHSRTELVKYAIRVGLIDVHEE